MSNNPDARIGKVLEVDLSRPKDRQALLDDPKFYAYSHEVLQFPQTTKRSSSASHEHTERRNYVPRGVDDYEPGHRFYFNDYDGIEYEVISYT